MDRSAKPAAAPASPAADPPARPRSDSECDRDLEDDYSYFASTYRPLSNLPTPPLSSRHSSALPSPRLDQGEALELFGPAVHLVNMLPPAASLATPSVALVQAMLIRAALPLDTVALAVCILDSLDVRFSRLWRRTCPLGDEDDAEPAAPAEKRRPTPGKRHTLPFSNGFDVTAAVTSSTSSTTSSSTATPSPTSPLSPLVFLPRPRHIDAVFPEIIILASLVIAAKFTDDGHAGQQAARAYCAWGGSLGSSPEAALAALSSPSELVSPSDTSPPLWSTAQLSATERCIMESLGYRILPLLDADLLADARADMRRAGVQARQREERLQERLRQEQQQEKTHESQESQAPSQPRNKKHQDLIQSERRCHVASRSDCFGLFG